MLIHSTATAQPGAGDASMPVPTPLTAALSDADLILFFRRFCTFMVARGVTFASTDPVSLNQAIYSKCLVKLLELDGNNIPVTQADPNFFDFNGLRIQTKACKLALLTGETLPELIRRTHTSLAPADAYEFQLYLYVALVHFSIWYCTEAIGEPVGAFVPNGPFALRREYLKSSNRVADPATYTSGSLVQKGYEFDTGGIVIRLGDGRLQMAGTGQTVLSQTYRLPSAIRNYVADYIHLNWPTPSTQPLKSYYSTWPFKESFRVEDSIDTMWGATRLGPNLSLVSRFRAAIGRMLATDVDGLVAKLGAPGGRALRSEFGAFGLYGFGEGSGTIGMFGQQNAGLLFFDYELTSRSGALASELLMRNLPLFGADSGSEAGASFMYLGLDEPHGDGDSPTITMRVRDDTGRPCVRAARPTIHAKNKLDHRFERPGGPNRWARDWKRAALAANAPDARYATVDLATNNPGVVGGHEEVLFIMFRHSIGATVAESPLDTEWRLSNNHFYDAGLVGGLFAGRETVLRALILAASAAPGFEVDAYLTGDGLGAARDGGPGNAGPGVQRRASQLDNQDPDTIANGMVRYGYGSVTWLDAAPGQSTGWLFFSTIGYASPLRCTWDTHLQPYSVMLGTLGNSVPPFAGAPSFNCVLAGFRALYLFEAMVERIIAEADAMVTDGQLALADRNTLASRLSAYLANEAHARVVLPSGKNLSTLVNLGGGMFERREFHITKSWADQFTVN